MKKRRAQARLFFLRGRQSLLCHRAAGLSVLRWGFRRGKEKHWLHACAQWKDGIFWGLAKGLLPVTGMQQANHASGKTMYFMALVAPEVVDARVRPLKQWLFENWGSQVGLKSPAHITLVPPFWMDAGLEPALCANLDRFAQTQMAFPIRTQNFASFGSRTLFIQPFADEALVKVKRDSDAFFANNPFGFKPDGRPFHPHLTLATRDLSTQAFHEAWAQLQTQIFSESWTQEGVSLLRHNKKNWDVVHTSQFQKMAV